MKYKIIITIIAILFLINGCVENKNEKLICTLNEKDGNYKRTETLEITTNNNKIVKLKETTIAQMDKKEISVILENSQDYMELYEDLDGVTLKITKEDTDKIKTYMEIDYNKINKKKIKDALGENFDGSELLEFKNMDIDTFKKANLNGYECK